MKIETYEVGALKTNCYFIHEDRNLIVIDPGDEGDYLSEKILSKNADNIILCATHGHFDHVLGSLEISTNFNVPFQVNQKDHFLVKTARKNAIHWTGADPELDAAIPTDFGGEKISPGNLNFRIIPTPGHTPGSVCFYNEQENILFCGDLIFKDGVGRTDFSYSSLPDLLKSIKTISKLHPDTKVYPGHGDSFYLSKIASNLESI